MVVVGASCVPNSGEGLFARVRLPKDTIVSFYHGVRHPHEQAILPKTGYSIYVDWDIPSLRAKNTEVMDILPQHQHSTNYSSTLAHKVKVVITYIGHEK